MSTLNLNPVHYTSIKDRILKVLEDVDLPVSTETIHYTEKIDSITIRKHINHYKQQINSIPSIFIGHGKYYYLKSKINYIEYLKTSSWKQTKDFYLSILYYNASLIFNAPS